MENMRHENFIVNGKLVCWLDVGLLLNGRGDDGSITFVQINDQHLRYL